MSAPRLTIVNLGYAVRGRTLLHGVSLVSGAGACVALVGANGSGKTTLLRLCHGLVEPSRGEVRWGEQKPGELGRRIAMVFQKPCLLRRSAYANVDYALRLHRFSGEERRRRVGEALELVGLGRLGGQQAFSLSGGEQQRLAIARACALSPDVVLLDEPTGNLDSESIATVERIIGTLKSKGVKVVLASHNLSQVKRLCDEVVFLDHGRLVAHAAREEFFSATENRAICDFIRLQAAL